MAKRAAKTATAGKAGKTGELGVADEALFGIALDTPPMEARSAEELPRGDDWQYEPKWDGFRCLAFRNGENVELRAKSGKPLGRYFPEILALLGELPVE
jgi:ATP-dependent DNA ligase